MIGCTAAPSPTEARRTEDILQSGDDGVLLEALNKEGAAGFDVGCGGLSTGELLRFNRVGMAFNSVNESTVVALDDIDFALARGEFLSVVGPSGRGKSTLLRLAAGLELPTSGEVLYDGVRVEGPSPRRGIAFQSYSVFP